MFLLYNISNLWHTLKTKDDDILTNNGNEEKQDAICKSRTR